jgi:magnesium transporter
MPLTPPRQIRIVVAATSLLSFMSVWKAAALALAELGVAVFFLIGVERAAIGAAAPWFVLAACLLGAFVRAIDGESWGFLIPGGLVGRAERAFGPKAVGLASAAVLTERLLLVALASVVVGRYATSPVAALLGGWHPAGHLSIEELVTLLAAFVIGLLWIRARLGFNLAPNAIARGVWIGIGVLTVLTAWGVLTAVGDSAVPAAFLTWPPPPRGAATWSLHDVAVPCLLALGLALSATGGGDALARAAHEFPPPRMQALRRTGLLVVLFSLLAGALPAFLFTWLVPEAPGGIATDTVLVDLARHLTGPAWATDLLAAGVIGAAFLLLVPAAHAALEDAELLLQRLSLERMLPDALARRHPRLGTSTRAIDVTAAAAIAIMLVSGGQMAWLATAYAIAVAATLCLKIATLLRLRAVRGEAVPLKAPFNLRIAGREIPLGLVGTALLVAAAAIAMLAAGDLPAWGTTGLLAALALLFAIRRRRAAARIEADLPEAFELLPSAGVSLDQVEARPGNVLVPVRNPHALAHVVSALEAAGDRDVVVMTVRLLGIDVEEDALTSAAPTMAERHLFSQVIAVAERHNHPVRLLVVPAHDVFDAVIATVVRLGSSEVYVGESASLAADDQARLLGDAWERADPPEGLRVRLVIQHHSGRRDAYHLGAHPPSLKPADLDLIHRLWLDATKAIGPHVHHHDVVRAALTHMKQRLTGPEREDALAVIRQVARPADELATAVHARDFSRLRDMTRNRDASDLASVLTDLTVDDQVVAFRVLPRKDAAAVFEYLSHEAQEALLKAMVHEDVAALLNNMAPDDRTMFLEELPAAATRQLLALLTPAERSVALTLLGYPEDSIGRLMTPHYVQVREHWTIREVLDHIRTHGQDSETLSMIYVVDDQNLLIDDIRIGKLLLASPDSRVADLMDRRFVALKATHDQATAVAEFRKHDRSALPVTDSAGMLIGIVTIDDVLDVAEAAATKEIQRIGGSEALDEPYMQIAFWRMIQKRGGWLSALFLGEMLTATAMAFFESQIVKAAVLAIFVPLIISSGGNSGSQASSLVIRALALGEVTLGDWWRIVRREILAGLALGTILGTIGLLRITLWSAFSGQYGEHWFLVAMTVGLALVGVVLWGTIIGSVLPLLLRRLGFDPATSSAPFVATIVDVTGLVIYFTVAISLLRGTLL